MPISKINTVTYANMAKVNSVAKASISKIYTLEGAAAEVAFADDYSTVLDGTNDHVTAHGAASEVGGNAGSVSVWFKLETVAYTKWLFEILVDSNNLVQVYYHGSTNQTRFEHVGGGSSNEIATTTAIENNGWHHLVMTWDTSANALIGYIDGSSVATGNAAAFTGTPISIFMGYSAWGNAWEGNINDFAIFDDVLTAGEVTAIYNCGIPTDESERSGLVGYWKFEENTGTSIADSSSNSNVATLVNGTAFEAGGTITTAGADTPAPYTKSLLFDTTNDGLRMYGVNSAGSGGYENTYAEMADFAAPMLDNNAPFTWDVEFRFDEDANRWDSYWGNYNISTNGGLLVQVYTWGSNAYVNIQWHRKTDSGGGGTTAGGNLYHRHYFNGLNTNHFTGSIAKGFWHKLTICKGPGDSLDAANFQVYMNGYLCTDNGGSIYINNNDGSEAWATDYGPIPEAMWVPASNNQGYRWFDFFYQGGDCAVGSMSWYGRALTRIEVNDLYDGGARLGGSADQAKIMHIDPTTAATACDLLHYYYYDAAVDGTGSETNIDDKIAAGEDPEFKLVNCTIADIVSATTPQTALFLTPKPPGATYAGETVVLTCVGSQPGVSTVRWYSDSGHTSLLNTGETYSHTVPAAGDITLYLKDTNSAGTDQFVEFTYTSFATAGHENYAYNMGIPSNNNGSAPSNYSDKISAALFDNDGKFSFSIWFKQEADNSFNGMMYTMVAGSNYDIRIHGNSNYPRTAWKINGVTTYVTTYGGRDNWAFGQWHVLTCSHDPLTGTVSYWTDGAAMTPVTDSNLEGSFTATGDFYFSISTSFGAVAQVALYDDVLTDAEAIAIQGGAGQGGAGYTQDIANLTGSKDKLIEYWKFDEAHDNDSADTYVGEILGKVFPLTNNVATNSLRRVIDRP